MIDYVKIIVCDCDGEKLAQNPLLDFYDNINTSTGEIITVNKKGDPVAPRKTAFYNGLKFSIFDSGLVMFAGSLHKYYNGGAHNYNDFDFNGFRFVLSDIKEKFGIDAGRCIIKNLEYGVNITPPIDATEVIKNAFLHSTTAFVYQYNNDEGKYKQAEKAEFIVKLYDKTRHYRGQGFTDVPDNLMRFEIKMRGVAKFKRKTGLNVLGDILNAGFMPFAPLLRYHWDKVLMYDPTIQIKTAKTKDFSNPNYWATVLEKTTLANFDKQRNKLKKIVTDHSENIYQKIGDLIEKKVLELSQGGMEIQPLYIGRKHTPLTTYDARRCEVTGLNISMQKKGSYLLSHTGLKYYYKTDWAIFEQMRRRYLTRQWHTQPFDVQIKELAHNIRNAKSNRNRKQRRLYQPQQINLLEIIPRISA